LIGSIPDFDIVSKANNVYRGGQPTQAGLRYLHDVLHVDKIIKLNTDAEGSDAEAAMMGMTVTKFPIPLRQQMFGGVDKARLIQIIEQNEKNCFIHCKHGQDRTGVAVYFYETRVLHQSKQHATNDMLSHGFHKVFHGLWECVKDD
jgi:protein tyrosine/serine phosphatase